MKYIYLILASLLAVSCNSQGVKSNTAKIEKAGEQKKPIQIAQYVIGIYEDSKRNLWFGTLEKGIAKYDGNRLTYYTKKDGLPSNRVTNVKEDTNGILWFNTGNGISKYDGQKFTNFTIKEDDFNSNMVSQLFIDSKGNFWIGTWGGVYTFDGKTFTHFPIPYPNVTTKINEDTKDWVTEINEDSEGNIWFAKGGYGACKYDGKSFTHFLKKDGLHSNNVTEIEFDKDGNIWFGTRVAEKDNPDPKKRIGKGGINVYNGKSMNVYPEIKGFNNNDVYGIYRDKSDNMWISTIANGVYRFDGKKFKNYNVPISIMGMMNDEKGNLWLAGAGGLYRINKNDEIINVTTIGPWQ